MMAAKNSAVGTNGAYVAEKKAAVCYGVGFEVMVRPGASRFWLATHHQPAKEEGDVDLEK